jgi:hypothetical protein
LLSSVVSVPGNAFLERKALHSALLLACITLTAGYYSPAVRLSPPLMLR